VNILEEKEIRQIPLAALFTALGVVFPQFFHLFGLGAGFLPMFLPVMLGSMFLLWPYALIVALLSPAISWLLTGMPPLAPPVLPVLTVELIVIALLIAAFRQLSSLSPLFILIVAIAADRIILLVAVLLIAPLMSIEDPLFSIGLVLSGLPGIALQLLIIPYTVRLIEKKYPQWKPQLEKVA
jgi:hypothetical protein